jgi:DNA-directed RNA polymerase I, II, and III subunit RPABC2
MSDNENDKDSDSEGEISDDEISDSESSPAKKPLFKPSINKKPKSVLDHNYDSDDDDVDDDDIDEEDDDEDDDKKIGGVADIVNDSDDDVDPEEETDEEEDDIELDEDGEPVVKETVNKSNKALKPKKLNQLINNDDDDDDDEIDDNYFQKFDNDIIKNYVNEFHPECLNHNYDEIAKLSVVVRNSDNIIVDPLHRTIPYLTKYEKARILGQRAKQIETGARPLVKIPENIIDSYIIAELELREKKIPFIIRRPIPGGACEYWNLRDLEVLAF